MEVLGSFSNKEQRNIKAFFFNQPMKLTLSVMMFFQRKYQKSRSFLYNEILAPYLPEKNHQSWSADCLCGYRYKKIMNSLKKLWLLNLHKNKNSVYNVIRYKRCFFKV